MIGLFFHQSYNQSIKSYPYCRWKKSCTRWYGKYPIIHRVLFIPGGAGFLPSTSPYLIGWLKSYPYLESKKPWFFHVSKTGAGEAKEALSGGARWGGYGWMDMDRDGKNGTSLKINGWNIIMEVCKIIFLSKWVICRFHVNVPGLYRIHPQSLTVRPWKGIILRGKLFSNRCFSRAMSAMLNVEGVTNKKGQMWLFGGGIRGF